VHLSQLGWQEFFDNQLTDEERASLTPARVVWEGRGGYRVNSGSEEWRADLSGRFRHDTTTRADRPTTGDWVMVAPRSSDGRATIHRVLARSTEFSRRGAGRTSDRQVIASNVDIVLLVTSLNQDFNLRRIERYLALAWESGANPVLVLNKADVCDDPDRRRCEAQALAPGLPVLVTSAARGDGIADLETTVRRGGTTALLGSSGVGKSSLVNALVGESRQHTLPVRDDDDRGRHSTTSRQLFVVPGGGVLIDTPGMRELQLWDADAGLERAFADVEGLADRCRFRNCAHGAEPGCAVTSAAADGSLDVGRLESYRKLQREERHLEAQQDQRIRADRTRLARRGAKALRQHFKLRGREKDR
jgi:ribosome biogenesis GTPase